MSYNNFMEIILPMQSNSTSVSSPRYALHLLHLKLLVLHCFPRGWHNGNYKLILMSLHYRLFCVLWAVSIGPASYIASLCTSSCSIIHRLTLATASASVSDSRKMSLLTLVSFNAKFSIHSLSEIFFIRVELQLTLSVHFTSTAENSEKSVYLLNTDSK
jgi:hypothetical protein